MRQFLVAMIGRSPSCARSLLAALYRLSPLVKFPQPLDYGQRAPTITPFFGPLMPVPGVRQRILSPVCYAGHHEIHESSLDPRQAQAMASLVGALDKDKHEEKFDLTSEGEALSYSFAQARQLAVQTARET